MEELLERGRRGLAVPPPSLRSLLYRPKPLSPGGEPGKTPETPENRLPRERETLRERESRAESRKELVRESRAAPPSPGGLAVTVHIHGLTVQEEADVEKVARELARQLERAALLRD